MKYTKVKQRYDYLAEYCHLADKQDLIVVTEWENGEGFDVSLGKEENKFQLTHGGLTALIVLCNSRHLEEEV